MYARRIFIFILLYVLTIFSVNAAEQIKVEALEEFSTSKPSNTINVKVTESSLLEKHLLLQDSTLTCEIIEISAPKRGKRNAGFSVKAVSYKNPKENSIHFDENIIGKYSKTVLSLEELKNVDYGNAAKSAALTVGGHFVKGLTQGVSFAEGVVKNEEGNRLKSGLKKVYKDSPLSYVEKGTELSINPGDEFYLVFKIIDQDYSEEENYKDSEP